MEKLRTNVVKWKFTFEVVYRDDRPNEIITVEAESIDVAIEKLPQPRITASLLTREEL